MGYVEPPGEPGPVKYDLARTAIGKDLHGAQRWLKEKDRGMECTNPN